MAVEDIWVAALRLLGDGNRRAFLGLAGEHIWVPIADLASEDV